MPRPHSCLPRRNPWRRTCHAGRRVPHYQYLAGWKTRPPLNPSLRFLRSFAAINPPSGTLFLCVYYPPAREAILFRQSRIKRPEEALLNKQSYPPPFLRLLCSFVAIPRALGRFPPFVPLCLCAFGPSRFGESHFPRPQI